ncbi:MAG TPA: peptide-methionine (R)-S-oxide reductase MsrB [Candidatus Saccharibacteria bacterium]|mgnify:CR=1 FL=1|nr:peptide-methionine (R)-S-oxide reductase MsrB [Candidatus Saccharibacteria bacterium]HMT39827.1 peptide-methionine (R)-S-oxide reductase MsrB [Candidatus Saccharibacteria bacterium]
MNKHELKKKLDPLTYNVTQNKATEPAFTGKYVDEHADGSYHCVVCDQKLFESNAKFDSGTGWPSFDQAVPGSIKMKDDDSHSMHRTEVVCSKCGAHLGHMFEDGPAKTTGKRFCINSCALELNKSSS